MKILMGIIFFHLLVILRARFGSTNDSVPYVSILLITICLVGYVVLMMFLMEVPQG